MATDDLTVTCMNFCCQIIVSSKVAICKMQYYISSDDAIASVKPVCVGCWDADIVAWTDNVQTLQRQMMC